MPSTTRWSKLDDRFIIWRTTTAPLRTMGRSTMRLTPTMATSGWLITGVLTMRFGMANDGHHQATIGLRGQPQMHGAIACDHRCFIVKPDVDLRVLAHGQHHGANEERQYRQPTALLAVQGIEPNTQGFELGHIHFFYIGEVGNAALGILHLLRDLAAQADDGNGLLIQALGIALVGHTRRLCVRCAGHVGLQVFMRDAACGAGAVYELKVHALDPGQAAHGG